MDYEEVLDGSGTDEDLPPSQLDRFQSGGRIVGSRRSAVHPATFSGVHINMETQIHLLEQEAYIAILRAFKAQSDAITWEKEGLITELRKELRVSDDEHRDLLTRVNGEDIIKRIREWRQAGGHLAARFNASQLSLDLPSPTVSGSRKKQKTSQRGQTLPDLSSMVSMQYPSMRSTGNQHFSNRGSSGVLLANEASEVTTHDPLIGRRVWMRWPEDNNFYEAVITRYNPVEGRHALVYDMNTDRETWEWVNFKEISPHDLRWDGEGPGIFHQGGHGGPVCGVKKSVNLGGFIPSSGRLRVPTKVESRRDCRAKLNGLGFVKSLSDEIELLNTETLVREVERVFGVSHPDPMELDKAKRMLKEHEQALVDAIARLADASDGESDGEHQFLHRQAMERE